MTLGSFFKKDDAPSSRFVGVVTNSVELSRILNLPRRVLDLSSVQDVTPLFAKSGELAYWPIQSAALIEAAQADGLFAPIGVGWGKTLIGLSLPEAMDSKKAVYLVKSDLRRQLDREAETFYGKHFHLPLDRITVVTYHQLSQPGTATVLDQIEPDLIIADEAHMLRRFQSARTKRFLRYMRQHPECRFAALSGTMTNRSILDYAHLIELALRKNSPLPRGYSELRDWSGALDVDPDYYMRPGALRHFCHRAETVREGYQRRLIQTHGIVATEKSALATSLTIRRIPITAPSIIADAIAHVEKHWEIGGEEITDATSKARVIKQIHCGFYYQWRWPGNDPDVEWLWARAAWNSEVRERLKGSSTNMDSPHLLEQAAKRHYRWIANGRPEQEPDALPLWNAESWPAWERVKHRPPPPVEAVWLSDYAIKAALDWASNQKHPAIIWYRWKAVGEALAAHLPHFGAGTDAGVSTAPAIVCSIRSQGTGKNLQHFCRNLFISLPPNGTTFEQAAGRTHRPGQLADAVVVDWFGFNDRAMEQIVEDASYMQATTGQRQKVLYANHVK